MSRRAIFRRNHGSRFRLGSQAHESRASGAKVICDGCATGFAALPLVGGHWDGMSALRSEGNPGAQPRFHAAALHQSSSGSLAKRALRAIRRAE
jgi:hypothetical protein